MSVHVRIGAIALAAGLVLVVAFSVPGAGARTALQPCTGSRLTGSFWMIPGSAGAGNVVYRLRLVNASSQRCFVTGIPMLTLLDHAGHRLPTHARFAGSPGTLSAVIVPLAKGEAGSLTARFSPDVPGPGERTFGPCEKTSYQLLVARSGGGTLVVPITPATPVCEHGSLQLSVFTAH
jgi:hypothetical protein